MNVPPDVYQHIASFSDDVTVLRMLSTNRKFNDPILFQRMIRNRYPLLEKYKLPDEDWKHFYLRMIQAIYSLAEDYNFPYIPDWRFNPVEIYQKLQKPRKDDYWGKGWGEGVQYSTAVGRLDLLKRIVESAQAHHQKININTINQAIGHAVRIKNTPILEYLMETFKYSNYDHIVERAASYNNSEIFDRYLDQVTHYYPIMGEAASSGNVGFIYKLLEKDPEMNLREPLYLAAKKGHLEVVRILLNANNNYNLNSALEGAGKSGNVDILKLLIERGANTFDFALRFAASNGSLDAVQFIMENYRQYISQNDLNDAMLDAMLSADSEDKINVLKYLISQGANNFDRILSNAAFHGNLPLAQLMIQHGATNIQQALEEARERVKGISGSIDSEYHRNELNNLIKFVEYFSTLNQ